MFYQALNVMSWLLLSKVTGLMIKNDVHYIHVIISGAVAKVQFKLLITNPVITKLSL